mmetsp:Transcript_66682/g.184624  ORF Transcript_66682/g.184624 Transcript_66682/m.184624 type:complete len:381 (-) Transcript_66682:572-1714(-)
MQQEGDVLPDVPYILPGRPVHHAEAVRHGPREVAAGGAVHHGAECAQVGGHPGGRLAGEVRPHKLLELRHQLVGDLRRRQVKAELDHGIEGAAHVHDLRALEERGVLEVDGLVEEVADLGGQDVDFLHGVYLGGGALLQADAVTHIVGVHDEDVHHALEHLAQQTAEDEGEAQEGGGQADAQGSEHLRREEEGQEDDARQHGLHDRQDVAEEEPDACVVLHRRGNDVEALESRAESSNKLLRGDIAAPVRVGVDAVGRAHEHLPRALRVVLRHHLLEAHAQEAVGLRLAPLVTVAHELAEEGVRLCLDLVEPALHLHEERGRGAQQLFQRCRADPCWPRGHGAALCGCAPPVAQGRRRVLLDAETGRGELARGAAALQLP